MQKRPLPIVFTGKAERYKTLRHELAELLEAPARIELHLLSLLEIEPALSETAFFELRQSIREDARLLFAAFSVNGIETLARLLSDEERELVSRAEWGILSAQSAEALDACFGAKARFLSPDETGAGLARELLSRRTEWEKSSLIALAAERGREEFYEILRDAGIPFERYSLYRSRIRSPSEGELRALPQGAWILLGSPQIAEAFWQRPEWIRSDLRFACLGKTTAQTLRRLGADFHQAQKADYAGLIRELRERIDDF